jgi:hypothetical protein
MDKAASQYTPTALGGFTGWVLFWVLDFWVGVVVSLVSVSYEKGCGTKRAALVGEVEQVEQPFGMSPMMIWSYCIILPSLFIL